jgi:leader peptidase (prepilin peptidase)/N-methyltransferase
MPLSFIFLISVFVFCFGAIIGSFLNVVIFRLNTGRKPTGRSACLSCGKTLGVLELVPIVSYLALAGRCKKCGSHISIQYPIVEALTGLVFLLLFFTFKDALLAQSGIGHLAFVVSLILASLLIAIGVYDLRHKIIPDILVFLFIGFGACVAIARFILISQAGIFQYLDLAAGPLFFFFFYVLWRYSNGTWMGLGDGKLALGIGLCLGFTGGLSALILAFWSGAVVGLALIGIERVLPRISLKKGRNAITMRSEIPFAPFLILGMALVFLFHIHVLSFF